MLLIKKYLSQIYNYRKLARLLRSTVRVIYSLLEITTVLIAVFLLILGIIYMEDTIEQKTEWGKALLDSIEHSQILGTIENISIVSVHDFNIVNYKEFDLIITTQELENKSEKIVEIDEILSENSIYKIEKAISLLRTFPGYSHFWNTVI